MNTITQILSVILTVFSALTLSFGQENIYGEIANPENIVFRDTVDGFAFDSLTHNLGIVPNINVKLIKYFKYVGQDTVYIRRAWTGDPHYICRYPNEPLVYGKIYTFEVCFSFQSRQGPMWKQMGFELSNDKRINFLFKGHISPKD